MVGVFQGLPVYIKDVAEVIDAANEPASYVRHGWGAAAEFSQHHGSPGTRLGAEEVAVQAGGFGVESPPAFPIASSKQTGANSVSGSGLVIDCVGKPRAEFWRWG